ncbi:MAG TPA: hypothetical protein VIP11_06780 [Gemmatimonadaceae bacterium]
MTSPLSPGSRELARELIERECPRDSEPTAAGACLQRLCARISNNLRVSVGDDGYNALVARALKRVDAEHPALRDIHRTTDSGIQLDGIAAGIDRHGQQAVAAAVESLLAALIDLLSSLIGADMVLNLLDANPPLKRPNEGRTP